MRWLREWVRRLLGRSPTYVVALESDTPEVVKEGTLYLVG
jgi:hypothetical protein